VAAVDPTVIDEALRLLVGDALAAYAPSSGTLTHGWSDEAGMWFTEVTPRDPAAASLSIAFDGNDLLSVTVGTTWFEIFPVTSPRDLDQVREIVEAVFAGRVEESGRTGRRFARITLESGPITVGHIHMPRPWKGRASRRYQSYDGDWRRAESP